MTDTAPTPLSLPRRVTASPVVQLAQSTPSPRITPASLPRPSASAAAAAGRTVTVAPSKPMVLTGHPLASEPGWLPGDIAAIRRSALDRAGVAIARQCQSGAFGADLANLGLRTRIVVDDVVRKVIKPMASMTASLLAGSLADADASSMARWTERALANACVTVPDELLESFAGMVANSVLDAYAPYVRDVSAAARTVA